MWGRGGEAGRRQCTDFAAACVASFERRNRLSLGCYETRGGLGRVEGSWAAADYDAGEGVGRRRETSDQQASKRPEREIERREGGSDLSGRKRATTTAASVLLVGSTLHTTRTSTNVMGASTQASCCPAARALLPCCLRAHWPRHRTAAPCQQTPTGTGPGPGRTAVGVLLAGWVDF